MNSLPKNARPPRKAAFSLVEVVLAIGIFSVAALSILGMLPVGLTTIHDAKNDMTHAQIMGQMASTVLQTPFDKLESYAAEGPFYFDPQGRQLDTAEGALFSATVTVNPGDTTTFPGASANLSASAKSVQILVSTVPPGAAAAISSSQSALIVPKS